MEWSSSRKGKVKITKLLMITGNPGKAEELRKLLSVDDVRIDYADVPLLEIQSLDIRKIGRHKTLSALRRSDAIGDCEAVLTDDTGLACRSLNGLPGPLIKWFLQSIGTDGIYDLVRDRDRTAVATCLLTLGVVEDRSLHQFEGSVAGKLVEARGQGGFGWDRIFMPEGYRQTYGEMDRETKNAISHRVLAVERLRRWLIS